MSVVRSSLEEMLDSLQRNEECKNPADTPPALPARPASKARLPKRPLSSMFGVSPDIGQNVKNNNVSFGRKKVACSGESPYTMLDTHEHRLAENGLAGLATRSSCSSDSGWDNSIEYYIKKQLRVWCRLQNGQWESGKIQSSVGGKASVTLLDGTAVTVSTGELLPANAEILDGVDNLVGLGYLNEPSVLCNLQYRYQRDVIYTMAGPVLLAINPFKDVSNSGSDAIMAYREKILDSPHVYAVANAVYNDMMRDGVNQTIIISGESGAGKSVSANLAIEYLIEVGGEGREIACKIRETGCILEAFGNAKTSRNKNSSRFGKLIDIQYDARGTIQGAYIHTLLLEKSRISQLCRSERSYHVFYQMCAGAPSDMRDKLNLRMANEYKLLNKSGCLKIHDVDDAQNFQKLMDAMNALRISHEDQECIFKLLAAVLWLGNISFEVIDHENHVTVVADEASRTAAKLMGCKVDDLMVALSTNNSQSLMLQQAIDTRDSMAQFVYTSLFNWLVEAINTSLEGSKEHSGRSISILDTYGFESLQKNSFEQLLINYADERLHQHFVRHLFKLEQEEYDSEGIEWKKVDFIDNQGCLDIFEEKTEGILSILEEASNASEATLLTFASKIKQHLSSVLCFNDEKGTFTVPHYAGEVKYEMNGILEKNRDTLQSNIIAFLLSCCKTFLTNKDVSDPDKQSIGSRFKGQLFKLIRLLEKSNPHFIRCIRPNAKQLHGMYEKDIVLQQLRCSGVLETIKISKSRYPTRMKHQEFASRFGCLLVDKSLFHDPLSTSIAILQQYHVLPEMYQLGYTKIYFRAEQVSELEKLKKQVMQGACKVDKGRSGSRVICDFHELMLGIVTLQSFVRGENSRRKCNVSTKTSYQPTSKSPDNLIAVVHIQSVTRGWLARRYFSHLLRWKKLDLDSPKTRQTSCSEVPEDKGLAPENLQHLPSKIEDLHKLVLSTKLSMSQKEQENTALREQVRQFEAQWSEHEIKMKSVEETWQRQMASLQKSLAAAKKSLGTEESGEDISATQNPAGNNGGVYDTVDHLSKDFEQTRQNFDNDAKALAEPKSVMPYSKQIEEFRKVKERFEMWKKEYKNRLRETRAKLVKGLNREGGKQSWWGRLSKRYTPT
uniref:myosin-2-like isoform X2 n=1 Tax=Erigeron canadensis TaxID=72917 RepID=UPI001CB99D65|nr:myosin-2-like isoform X2 [Erigeron canadensis]